MITKILLTALLGTASLYATAEIEKGSSVGNYAKPGASVEMRYESPKVDMLENAEVRIFLHPVKPYPQIKVHLAVDQALERVSDTKSDILITTKKDIKEYPLTVTVRSAEPGTHFIRLIVSAGGRSRAFTVPVHVGEVQTVKREKSGKRLKVMHAREEID